MGVREVLHRRVSGLDAATAVIAVVALLLLLPSGPNRWLSVALFALVAVRIALYGRFARRRPVGTATIQEAGLLSWDCETVWNLIKPAERAPLLDPTIRRGSQVPGTPSGLGEQQVFEQHDGSVGTIEVVEYVEHRRAVTTIISPTPEYPTRMVQAVEPTGGGCVYTYAIQIDLPGGRVSRSYEVFWREHAREHIGRVRQVLSDGGPPAVTPPPPDP